jgi:hypothetical protein
MSSAPFTRAFDWLMLCPRGRRLRRWSFVLTLPAAVASAAVIGLESGLALVALRMVLWLVVVAVAWRMCGERGEAVRDLLMHPVARRYLRLELRVLGAPLLAMARLVGLGPRGAEFAYHRGDETMAIAIALTPALLVEAAVFQLLLPGHWFWVHVAVAVLHVYGLVWLFALAVGPRHRVTGDHLLVRSGVLHCARIPVGAIRSVEVRRQKMPERGTLVVEGEAVMLPVRRRVDLWLELDEEVLVSRPVGEPVAVRRLGVAADDPEALAAALLVEPASTTPAAGLALPALVGLPDLVYGT